MTGIQWHKKNKKKKRKMNDEFQCHPLRGPVLSLKALKSGICLRVQPDTHFPWSVTRSSAARRRHIWNFSGCWRLKLWHQDPTADPWRHFRLPLISQDTVSFCLLEMLIITALSHVIDTWSLVLLAGTGHSVLNYVGLPSAPERRCCNILHLWFHARLSEEQRLFWDNSS